MDVSEIEVKKVKLVDGKRGDSVWLFYKRRRNPLSVPSSVWLNSFSNHEYQSSIYRTYQRGDGSGRRENIYISQNDEIEK